MRASSSGGGLATLGSVVILGAAVGLVMGTLDPDFADPRAEGDAIVAAMPSGLGTVAMVNGAGHYPHAQSPDEVAALVIPFLKEHAGA